MAKDIHAHLRLPTEEALYRLRALAELSEPMEPVDVVVAIALISDVLLNLSESVETIAAILPRIAPGGGSFGNVEREDDRAE